MLSFIRKLIRKSPLRARMDAYVQAQFSVLMAEEFDKHYYSRNWEEARLHNQHKMLARIGEKIVINCHMDSKLAEYIYKRTFENEEIQFLKKYLRPDDCFIDVGANIGFFTLVAAEYVGQAGSVWSFEPTHQTYQRLLTNIELNGFTQVHALNMALSNENATAKISVSKDGYDAWNTLGVPTAGEDFSFQEVETIRLDDFIVKHDVDPQAIALIKIDVEGWEVPVMDGATKLLSQANAPVLLVEFTEENARAAGFSCQDLYKMVESMGYQWFSYDARNNSLVPEKMKDWYAYSNLVATKHPEQTSKKLRGEI